MNKKILLDLYYTMKRIRCVEEEIANRYDQGKMRCPVHLSIGQEAIAAAFSMAVNKDDFAVSTHRGHAHFLGKGGDLKSLLAEIYGKASGCSNGKGGSMHLIDLKVNFMGTSAIVGNSIPIGVGIALSIKLKKKNQISCIFLGDGATEEGVFYESINFAVLHNLPVLFICENNLYSVYSPLNVRQPLGRKITNITKAIGIESNFYSTQNVFEIFKIIKSKINLVRKQKKPQFLEFKTYRWREHCGPNYDNTIGYRSENEFKIWQNKDPISILDKLIIDKEKINLINQKILNEIKIAFDFAEKSPFPKTSEAFKGVFSNEK